MYLGNSSDEISGIPFLQRHTHLVEIMRIKLALAVPINHAPWKIDHDPKTLEHVATDPTDHWFRTLLRIPIEKVSVNGALSRRWRNRRCFRRNAKDADLLELQRAEPDLRQTQNGCPRLGAICSGLHVGLTNRARSSLPIRMRFYPLLRNVVSNPGVGRPAIDRQRVLMSVNLRGHRYETGPLVYPARHRIA